MVISNKKTDLNSKKKIFHKDLISWARTKKIKFIIITGGVISGLGKGVAIASIGHLLSYDYKTIPIKCDGYLNVDPGTMNPVEHGEVFVLDDGSEVDMDFGHYERFLRTSCDGRQNLTMGKVFAELRDKERRGDFLGKTVQMIPHATDFIKEWWLRLAKQKKAEIVLLEIGGTVGDMENELYIEAARSLINDLGRENVFFTHLTYIPIPKGVNEQKTKPTQQSVSLLMKRGIIPDMILCRGEEKLTEKVRNKISLFCNVKKEAVLDAIDVDNIYKIPILLEEQGIVKIINKSLKLKAKPKLKEWKSAIKKKPQENITIAIAGKYTALEDSYASVVEALNHAGTTINTKINIKWLDTESIDSNKKTRKLLEGVDGVIVPGGFGSRGIDGKLKVIEYCRTEKIPYLGICYGLQLAVIEFMRNVCGYEKAHSTEVDPKTPVPVIDILPDKKNLTNLGGTLRLGAYKAKLLNNSLVKKLYDNKTEVYERHRHRFEVNPEYHCTLQEKGMVFSGLSPDAELVEFIELPADKHPYFVATQAHPELKSKPLRPAPLFLGLVEASKKKKKR